VPVIVLADVIFTLHYHFNMGIIIEKKTKYFAYINVSNGILHLLLNFLLIPVYGVWGAACATLASFTCLTTATYLVSRRFYRVHLEPARLAKIFIAAVVVYFAAQQVSVDDLLLSMLAKTAVVLSFPLLIHALGFFTEDEKARIRAFLRSHLKAGKAGNP
jgi:O-antigen/teichoic acid export membrane protein